MKTILTEKRKQILEKVRKTAMINIWEEFALIPTVYETNLLSNKLEEIQL